MTFALVQSSRVVCGKNSHNAVLAAGSKLLLIKWIPSDPKNFLWMLEGLNHIDGLSIIRDLHEVAVHIHRSNNHKVRLKVTPAQRVQSEFPMINLILGDDLSLVIVNQVNNTFLSDCNQGLIFRNGAPGQSEENYPLTHVKLGLKQLGCRDV